jgi:hypothetical protein
MYNVEGLILQDLGNDRRRNECNGRKVPGKANVDEGEDREAKASELTEVTPLYLSPATGEPLAHQLDTRY